MPDAPLTATRGPFTGGYTSSVPAFMARADQLTGATAGTDANSSRNCFIDPFTGGVTKRRGSAILNDAVTAVTGEKVTGILNTTLAMKCRKMLALDSPSMTTGYPALSALYGLDTNPSFPATDVGFPGTIYVNSHNSGANNNDRKNYSLLEEFVEGTTYSKQPPTKSAETDYRMKVVPLWFESGDGVYNRGAQTGTAGTDKFMQQFLTCGSRSIIQTQNWLYSPNLRATPWRWNKRLNETESIGTSTVRIYPTGPFPPLFPPTLDTLPAATANNSNWVAGDCFYISVIFQFEDGSYSSPFIPRATQIGTGALTSGLGFVAVGTIASGSKYPYLRYKDIAIGPEGTVARILLRTTKQNRTAAGDTVTVSPLDLRIVGVLRNNSQTVYDDYAGDDDSLLEDEDVVRVDNVLPRRARYIGTGDQRAIISYTLPNTAAIMLAPIGINAAKDRNFADTNANCYGSTGSYVRITSTDLELHYNAYNAAATFTTYPAAAGANNAVKFPLATYDTLEKMVDAINALTFSYDCKQWAAQLAPGIDGTMPTASLTNTTITVADATTSGANVNLTSFSGGFGPIGIGMKVAGTNITAGTYVVSKTSNSALTLSTAATAVAGVGLTFYQNTGDTESITIAAAASYGYIRAFSSTYPALLHMKPSAFADYATPDKSSVYFTVSSPGAASSGISLAPNSWVAGNRRLPHSSPRQTYARSCTGIADIEGAAIVAFSDGIHMFANQRGANTGEDADYRLFTVNDTRGCISFLGLTAGNGWAAYPTTEGIIITDKNRREFSISGDVFNPSDNTGDLAFEILTSTASVASDSDDQCLTASVFGSKLVIGFRRAASDHVRFLFYDFSPGIEASGVEELLNPETKSAYIWSPPAIYNEQFTTKLSTCGAMGSFRTSGGRQDYVSYDTVVSAVNTGRIDRVDTSFLDNTLAGGDAPFTYAVPAPFVAGAFKALLPQRLQVTHQTTGSGIAFGESLLAFANDQIPTFYAATVSAVTCVTSIGSTRITSAGLFGSVTAEMLVSGGADITAGTVVARKIDSSNIEITPGAAASNGAASLTFTPNNDQQGHPGAVGLLRVMARDATKVNFNNQIIPIDQKQRGKTDMFWVEWRNNTFTSALLLDKLWRIILQYDETDVA